MTAVPPRPAAPACPVGRVVYGDRPCDGPGSYYCDGEVWGSACNRYYKQKREGEPPAAPDVSTDTGALREVLADGLFDIDTSTRGLAAISYQAAADAILALPALRDLIAERDELAAKVERVAEVADFYQGISDRTDLTDHHRSVCLGAARNIRRALDPT